jgi:hypothetical protein
MDRYPSKGHHLDDAKVKQKAGWLERTPRKGSHGKKRMLTEQDPVTFACLLSLCSTCFSCKYRE